MQRLTGYTASERGLIRDPVGSNNKEGAPFITALRSTTIKGRRVLVRRDKAR